MDYLITKREVAEQAVLVGRRRAPRAKITAAIGLVLPRVFEYARAKGIALTGPPFVRYVDPNPELMTFEPGMPIGSATDYIRGIDAEDGQGLSFDILPGGFVATTIHVGPYETLHEAYAALERWMGDEGMTPAGAPWESYLTDPTSVPDPSDWKTQVFWPVS